MKKSVMLLDGSYEHTLAMASEIKQDFPGQTTILVVGKSADDLVLRTRYCDVPIVIPSPGAPDYPAQLTAKIHRYAPDVVIPVGYHSVSTLAALEEDLPASTAILLPPTESIDIALNKTRTLRLADELGIRVPTDFTHLVRTAIRNDDQSGLNSLPYPVFLKLAQEIGGNLTGTANSSSELVNKFKMMASEGYGDDILVQEFIDTEVFTYGCGLLYCEGEPVLEFQHVETRSVPRLGGSATRVHIESHDEVSESSRSLLDALGWEGPALVEFKKDSSGNMVLMEINPKFWASYALASRNGYRFGSSIVEHTTGMKPRSEHTPQSTGKMAFPLREMRFAVKHRATESLMQSILAILFPPAPWDIRLKDIHYYIHRYSLPLKKRVLSRFGGEDRVG